MNSSGKFNYFLRKYPILRFLLLVAFICVVMGSVLFIKFQRKPVPIIESIVPPVGSPGDVVLINGKNFGDIRDINYVEITGSKLTASSYISWSDNCIKVVLPANVQDGLVVVSVKNQKSNPALFANEVDIPIPVPTVVQITRPVIYELSSDSVNIGEILTISGNNFGETRNDSTVCFTIDYNNAIENADFVNVSMLTENMIAAKDEYFEYIEWTNTKIVVKVPDGASSGVVLIDNGKEKSDPKNITINASTGKKRYTNKKIYLLQYSADIADIVTNEMSTITLRCPIPFSIASQNEIQITETLPQPILQNYQNNLIHQVTKSKNHAPKSVFSQTFVLPVYEIHSTVNEKEASVFKSDKSVNLRYEMNALASDENVPSANEDVIKLALEIVGKEKNPYKRAKLIYNYMCENFEVSSSLRKNDSNPLELLKRKKGDSYDFAVIYTALLRSCGVPCLTDAGILINLDMTTQSHWWCEFYIDKVGWIPVDVALGCGLEYKKWTDSDILEDREFYFGNLDAHHITFSRGWNNLKPFSADNKIVQQPRSFALQNIWEEASENIVKYSSYWSVPVVKGVY